MIHSLSENDIIVYLAVMAARMELYLCDGLAEGEAFSALAKAEIITPRPHMLAWRDLRNCHERDED